MRRKALIAAVGLALGAATWTGPARPATARPAPQIYEVDPVHSTAIYRVQHMKLSWAYGRFNEVLGTFVLSDDPTRCAVDFRVKTASIDSGNAERDNHLRAARYFDAEKHPLMSFKSREVRKAGERAYEITGDFQLRGVTRPVTVKAEHVGSGKDLWGGYRAGFECVFAIKRSDFGMDKMLSIIGDEVRIIVSVEAVRKKK